uniref:Sushi domain-containing protein n=1 Tax=Plectus sambesii TaxID=2011161 RepID=A0A914UXD1_9BILA
MAAFRKGGLTLLLNVVLFVLLFLEGCITPVELCLQTASLPETTDTSATPTPCTIGTKPYGTYKPAPGTTVADGSIVILECDASAHTASTSAVVSATCTNGELTPTSTCLPCPDNTWIYDDTTNRCFKAFAATPGLPCDARSPCLNAGLQYRAPSDVAHTLNLPALIRAGAVGIQNNIVTSGQFLVGIGDPTAQGMYQLSDNTPVPLADLQPLFVMTAPFDNAANTQKFITVRFNGGVLGFDDTACLATYGIVCQIQLTT